jgi:ketopantoate reductase
MKQNSTPVEKWRSDKMTSEEFKIHVAKKHAKKKPAGSANEMTKQILRWLNMNGFVAWRNNTMGVWDAKKKIYRKHHGRKGVSDILGVQKKTGRFIGVEVKFGKDKLSKEQELFINDINRSGGFAIAVYSFADFLEKIETI